MSRCRTTVFTRVESHSQLGLKFHEFELQPAVADLCREWYGTSTNRFPTRPLSIPT